MAKIIRKCSLCGIYKIIDSLRIVFNGPPKVRCKSCGRVISEGEQ